MKLTGIAASKGIAIAKVFELKHHKINITKEKAEPAGEIKRFEAAIKQAISQIEKVKAIAETNIDAEHAAVFEAHIQLANDPMISDEVIALIRQEECNAVYAMDQVAQKYIELFSQMDDAYMKERAADIKDVSQKIIFNLLGIEQEDLSQINEEVILVALDLTPSETSQLNKQFIKGFATDIGGRTSHSAIIARSLEIPAVLGLKEITAKVKTGDVLAINGTTGEVFINPSAALIKELKAAMALEAQQAALWATFKNKPSVTKDGYHFEIAANIGSPNDVPPVLNATAEAIGLFRSEFLYMDATDWPTEEQQFQAYKIVLEQMQGKKVVIRTLDIGGDKNLKYFSFPEEMNPFLGWRAVRFTLDRKDIFTTQLKALIRASQFGKLAIMFPMIATVDEFLAAKALFNQVYQETKKTYPQVANDIEVGMMVEIPSAAVLAEQFCQHADFVSIGTNDLMQYSMAADRMNEKLAYLYQPLNPAILKLIKMTIDGAHKHKKWVGMCGEMAGDPQALPLLLGLGLDEFSMSASSVLQIRELASRIDQKKAAKLVALALEATNEAAVKDLIAKHKHW